MCKGVLGEERQRVHDALYSWGVWAAGLGIVWMVELRAREVGCSETWQTGWVGGGGECNTALWLQKPAKNQQET